MPVPMPMPMPMRASAGGGDRRTDGASACPPPVRTGERERDLTGERDIGREEGRRDGMGGEWSWGPQEHQNPNPNWHPH